MGNWGVRDHRGHVKVEARSKEAEGTAEMEKPESRTKRGSLQQSQNLKSLLPVQRLWTQGLRGYSWPAPSMHFGGLIITAEQRKEKETEEI